MMRRRLLGNCGQSFAEYVLFIAVVGAALAGMHTYVSRAAQAHLSALEEKLQAKPVP